MRRNKGITLISLVITIIVLLILAAVSIATLTGENGILSQANKAKVETRGASVEEEYSLWKINQEMDSKTTEETAQTLEELLDSLEERNLITPEERTTIDETGKITIGSKTIDFGKEEPPLEQANVGEKVTGDKNKAYTQNGKTAIIPVGFTIVPGCDNIDEGLVISDNENDTELDSSTIVANGNQFVWIPVKQFDEFKREGFIQNIQENNFVSDEPQDGKYYEPKGDGINVNKEATGTQKEAQEMYKSVKDNGGFYIGRYEAGITDEETTATGIRGNMVCKKGVKVYNNIKWGNSIEDETGGAIYVARKFATNLGYKNVKSTLCYGVQWDAVMKWMSDVYNTNGKRYIEDSTGMGWYKKNISEGNLENKTGVDIGDGENNKSNKVKNIYDMAGNVYEWTMEVYGKTGRIPRGGCFNDNGDSNPAYVRDYGYSATMSNDFYGFRPTLYLY